MPGDGLAVLANERSLFAPGFLRTCLSALAREGGDVRRAESLNLADNVPEVGRLDHRFHQERHLESVSCSFSPWLIAKLPLLDVIGSRANTTSLAVTALGPAAVRRRGVSSLDGGAGP
jgi:hypothetical protein